MILTKYEHACFTLEKDGKLLVVDPGEWTTDLGPLDNVVAVVITHEHPDHLDPSALDAIIARSPDTVVYAHESITNQLSDNFMTTPVEAGDVVTAAPFTLEFFGGKHAVIHESYPRVVNLGVLVNDSVYYPGDSFVVPNKPIKALALPVGGPWQKISEPMDFAAEVGAKLVFPTHDAVLSKNGKALPDRMIPSFMESHGGKYQRLTEPVEIDG